MLVATQTGYSHREPAVNLSAHTIRASYVFCRRMSRRAGSSFPISLLLLPRAKRQAMHALYAFMRHTDDLADNPQPAHLRAEALVAWRAALEHALLGQFDPPEKPDDPAGHAVLPALADAVRCFRVPPEHLRMVIDGVEMDLKKRRYETFEELQEYCRRVASAVGLACLHVWGFRGHEALEPARKCGIAFQLTNILRDLPEDARQDRIYLPLADMRRCNYSEDDLINGTADERFTRLMEIQIQRTEQFYREGAELIHWLEPDGQRTFGMMASIYRALLRRIKRRPADVFKRRITLSRPKKLQIAARWTLLPPKAAVLL